METGPSCSGGRSARTSRRRSRRRALSFALDVCPGSRREAVVVVAPAVTPADRLDDRVPVLAAVLRPRLALPALLTTAKQLGAELALGALLIGGACQSRS